MGATLKYQYGTVLGGRKGGDSRYMVIGYDDDDALIVVCLYDANDGEPGDEDWYQGEIASLIDEVQPRDVIEP